MRNNYRIDGNVAHVELKRRKKPSVWTTVDLSDLSKMQEYPCWNAAYSPKTKSFYVVCVTDGKTIALTRMLLGITDRRVLIDHENKITLDNRRDNLRDGSYSLNNLNRNLPKNNTTGYRGVSIIHTKRGPVLYQAQIMIDKQTHYLGRYEDILVAAGKVEQLFEKRGLGDEYRRSYTT